MNIGLFLVILLVASMASLLFFTATFKFIIYRVNEAWEKLFEKGG